MCETDLTCVLQRKTNGYIKVKKILNCSKKSRGFEWTAQPRQQSTLPAKLNTVLVVRERRAYTLKSAVAGRQKRLNGYRSAGALCFLFLVGKLKRSDSLKYRAPFERPAAPKYWYTSRHDRSVDRETQTRTQAVRTSSGLPERALYELDDTYWIGSSHRPSVKAKCGF